MVILHRYIYTIVIYIKICYYYFMANEELINNIKNKIIKIIPANLSKQRKQKIKKCLEDFLNIAAKEIDNNNNSIEIKEFVLMRLADWIYNISLSVFEYDMDENYDEILQKISFLVYEVTFKLLEKDIQDDESYNILEYEVQRNYSKILREVGSNYRKQIKDTDLERNSAYFWQYIFIKYTPDNKRIFYPSFFSDGYYITSEEQFKNYQKYGNKFFIIFLFIFIFMAKFKLLKALFYFNLISIQTFGIIIGLLITIGLIYNLIVPKLIFKENIKTSEKYWINNYECIKFLKKFIYQNIFVLLIIIMFVICGANCKEVYVGASLMLITYLSYLFYLYKQNEKIHLFVIQQEKNAIKSFIISEIKKYENIPNFGIIKENLHIYLNDYVDYIYKITKLDYIKITNKIHIFIRSFVRFNKVLYLIKINEEKHKQYIEDRFLTHFEYV